MDIGFVGSEANAIFGASFKKIQNYVYNWGTKVDIYLEREKK